MNPEASAFMKETKEQDNQRHKHRERHEIVQDADFAVDVKDSKLTSGGMLCKFGGQTCVPPS